MKAMYENPTCTLISFSSADVITVSGTLGVVFSWFGGNDPVGAASSIEDDYGN